MKLSPTPLLLALLPLLATAAPADEHDATDRKITKLAAVQVVGDAKDAARDTGSNTWGNSSLKTRRPRCM